MNSPALDHNFTMDEVAGWLRVSRRQLQELVKRHPFFYGNGNRKLFSEDDLLSLRTAMRQESECPSSSSRRVPVKHHTGPSGARTLASIWTEAQSLFPR